MQLRDDEISQAARETVVGCVTARALNQDARDARVVLIGYLDACGQRGMEPCIAWSKLASTSLAMITTMASKLAEARGVELEIVLQEMGLMAARL